jgi:hypothetical protein
MLVGLEQNDGKSIAGAELIDHDHHSLLHVLQPFPLHVCVDVEHGNDVHAITRHLPAMTPWHRRDPHKYLKLVACLAAHNYISSCESF